MKADGVVRQVIVNSKAFKKFWKEKGPFRYALTSKEYPPVLLEDEEWLFSNDMTALLKSLMQFDHRKMKMVKAPFNLKNKSILRPEMLSEWKINNFPGEWNACVCDIFVPEGHLTRMVIDLIQPSEQAGDSRQVEASFFQCLEEKIDQLGYELFKPFGASKYASLSSYLADWEKDEKEAGLLS